MKTTTDLHDSNDTAATADEPRGPGGRHTSDQFAPEDRGRLEVASIVVRKVAKRAADLTPGTLPSTRRIAGVGAGTHGARARIDGEGSAVTVTLQLALHYPSPIRELSDRVRTQVINEVLRITGYQVRSVRITVSALLPETHPRVE